MLARVKLVLLLSSFIALAQNVDPLKKETENITRKHDSPAPEVAPLQRVEQSEREQKVRKSYSPIERRSLSLSITRANSIVKKEEANPQPAPALHHHQQQQTNTKVQNGVQNSANSQENQEPIKGVCVLQEDVKVKTVRHFADMPCLVIYPDVRVAQGRAVFEPDGKNYILRGRLIALDNKPENLQLLRSGSENVPVEVKKFLLANALVHAVGKTAEQTSGVVQEAIRGETRIILSPSPNNPAFVQRGPSFSEVMKKLPQIAGIFALGNFLQGLAMALAPEGKLPPEFVLPAGTELYFSRP